MTRIELGEDLGDADFCHLTTTGRVSGRPRTIEIWFALERGTLYMLSGGGDRSDWVRNLRRDPEVSVRIGDRTIGGLGRVVESGEEDARARRLVFGKYQERYAGDLTRWAQESLPVAVDLELLELV